MMSLVWQDGQFAWPFVWSVAWLVVLLLASDYLWRVSRLGGRRLAVLAGLGALAGVVLIYWAGG